MAFTYLDHNATTPLDERVFDAMLPYLREQYGNASSRHTLGSTAREAVELARGQVAALVGAQPAQVVFTSGGTEANNLFIKGAAALCKPAQIAVSAIEHPCVARPAQELARAGWTPRQLKVTADGVVDMDDVAAALAQPTGIVSVMLANNETGTLQPVAEIAALARAAKAWMHTDAVQAVGKVPVDFAALGVHALTFSAHKLYGPKGVGALIVDKRLSLQPLLSGGGHEHGYRSGTENVAAIVGFGAACELAQSALPQRATQLNALRTRLEQGLRGVEAVIHAARTPRLPNTTYFAIDGIDGETFVVELDKAGFGVASGAACSSANPEPSATLLAMGVDAAAARGAVRVSLGKDNTAGQVDRFIAAVGKVAARLRNLTAMVS